MSTWKSPSLVNLGNADEALKGGEPTEGEPTVNAGPTS